MRIALFFTPLILGQEPACNSTACPYPDDWAAVVQFWLNFDDKFMSYIFCLIKI